MYRASCAVYYPDQQMHNIYINNILFIVSSYMFSVHLHHFQGPCTFLKLQNYWNYNSIKLVD